MFERTVLLTSATMAMSKVALIAGSSQHGNARLASAAYKRIMKIILVEPIGEV
jgi:hypothetical protein